MVVKLYLRDSTTTVTGGVMPLGSAIAANNGTPITVTATGASVNRSMSTTPGSAQIAVTLSSSAITTQQNNWFRRFVTPYLAAQSFTGITLSIFMAGLTSGSSSGAYLNAFYAYLWRPSTGIIISFGTVTGLANGLAETGDSFSIALSGSAQDGDVIIIEVLGQVTQSMSTSFTWTTDYEGTVDPVKSAAISSAASYISFSSDVPLQGVFIARPAPRLLQAVNRSNTY